MTGFSFLKNSTPTGRNITTAIGLIMVLAASVLFTSVAVAPPAQAQAAQYPGPNTQSTGPAYFGPAPNEFSYCESPTYFDPFPDNVNPVGSLNVGSQSQVTTNDITMTFTIDAEGEEGAQYPGFFPFDGVGVDGDQPKGVEMAAGDVATVTLSEPLFYSQWIFTDVDRDNEGFDVTPDWTEPGEVAVFTASNNFTVAADPATSVASFNVITPVGLPSESLNGRVQVDFLGAVNGIQMARDNGSGQSGFAVGGGCEAAGAAKRVIGEPDWNGTSYDVTYELRLRNNLPSTGTLAAAVQAARDQAAVDTLTALPQGIPLTNVQLQDELSDPAFSSIVVNTVTNDSGNLVLNPDYDGVDDVNLLGTGSIVSAETDELIVLTVSYTPDLQNGAWNDCAAGHEYSNQSTVSAIAANVAVSDVSDDGINPAPGNDNGVGGVDDPTLVTFDCPPAGLDIVKTVVNGPNGTCPSFAQGTDGPGTALQVTDTDIVTYCISVQNNGTSSASGVVVTDDQAPATFDGAIGTLAGGAEQTVSFDLTAGLASPVLNTAFANGFGPAGAPLTQVSDQALIAVNPLPSPVLQIVKTAVGPNEACPVDFDGGTAGLGSAVQVVDSETVTYCISVLNSGQGPATSVVITDAQAGALSPFDGGTIPAGEQRQFSFTVQASPTTPTRNVAFADGQGPYLATTTVSDDALIQVVLRPDPDLEIRKTAILGPDGTCPEFANGTPGAGAPVAITFGQTVTYCITVLNSGLGDATSVVVTDAQAPASFNGTIGDLAAGTEQTVSFDILVDAQTDETNTASASGQGINGPAGPVTDDAVIDASPQLNPILDIVKTVLADGETCPTTFAGGVDGPGAVLPAFYGDTVLYCIAVTNTGPTTATNVVVTDTQAPAGFDGAIGDLAPGAEQFLSYEIVVNANTPAVNTATVNGEGPNGTLPSATDDSVIRPDPLPNPVLDIVKTVLADGETCPTTFAGGVDGPGAVLPAFYGDTVLYCIAVTNTGPTTATNVVVTDTQAPAGFDGAIGDLAPGAEQFLSYEIVVNANTPAVNTATVNGEGPNGTLPSAADDSVIRPDPLPDPVLEIVKTVVNGPAGTCPAFVDGQSGAGVALNVLFSDTVTYCISVRNTGPTAATNTTIVDPQAPAGFDGVIGELAPNAEVTRSFDLVVDGDTPDVNTATVTGDGPNGALPAPTDEARINAQPIPDPVLEIVKTAVFGDNAQCPAFADGIVGQGDAVNALYGESITYCLSVKNTGSSTATAVVVTDAQAPEGFDGAIGALAINAEATVQFSLVVGADTPATNVASVTGEGPNGTVPTASDEARISPSPQPDPVLEVVKTAIAGPNGTCPEFMDGTAGLGAAVTFLFGDTATYCIGVRNTGLNPATQVTVDDDQFPDMFDGFVGTLAVNEISYLQYDVPITALTPDVNTATATGNGPNGAVTPAVDPARISAAPQPDPVLEIVKTAIAGPNGVCPTFDDGVFGEGLPLATTFLDTVTYCLVVKNTGQRDAVNVEVADPQAPVSFNGLVGELAVSQEVILQFDLQITETTPTRNTATVTGAGPNGPVDFDTDQALISPTEEVDPFVQIVKTAIAGPAGNCPLFADGIVGLGQPVDTIIGTTITYCLTVRNSGQAAATAVVITDPQAPAGFDGAVGILPVNTEQTRSFDLVIAADTPEVNVATVNGAGPNGAIPTLTDNARVNVLAIPDPVLEIVKTVLPGAGATCPSFADGQPGIGQAVPVVVGDAVTYCLTVRNGGLTTATAVEVSDPQAPAGFDGVIGTLEAGAESTLTFDLVTSDATPLVNTAVVVGVGPNGALPFDFDRAQIELVPLDDPLLEIVKSVRVGPGAICPAFADGDAGSGDPLVALYGTTVTYCITVLNSGAGDATEVKITDPQAPNLEGDIGNLASREQKTVSFDVVVGATTPSTNTATVTGEGPNGATPTVSDSAQVTPTPLDDPVLEIVKSVRVGPNAVCPAFANGDAGPGQPLVALYGTTITYCLTVLNSGAGDATDVVFGDVNAPAGFDGVVGDLASGAQATVSFDTVVGADTPASNTASVKGKGPNGLVPEVSDVALVTPTPLPDPKLEIVKSVRVGPNADCPAFADGDQGAGQPLVALYGTTVTYCMTVLNSGAGDATGVAITDTQAPASFDGTVGALAAGEQATVSFDVVVTATTPTSNTASATGNGPNGPADPVDDEALVTPTPLPDPVLEIVKSVRVGPNADCPAFADGDAGAGQAVAVSYGTTVTYCMTVLNSGAGDATDVVVSDPQAIAGFDGTIGDLPAGEQATVFFDVVASALLPKSNIATVNGEGPNGPTDPATDEALVDPTPLPNPVLEVVKTAVAGDAVDCSTVTGVVGDGLPVEVTIGESITFCIVASNSGPTAAESVVLTDPQAGTDSPWQIGTLAPGQSVTRSYSLVVTDSTPVANTASLTGSGPNGVVPPAEDRSIIDPLEAPAPAITLTNTVVLQSQDCSAAQEGIDEFLLGVPEEPVRWCFEVKNTGNTPLTEILFDNAPLLLQGVDILEVYGTNTGVGGNVPGDGKTPVVLLPGESIRFGVEDQIPDDGLQSVASVGALAAEVNGDVIPGIPAVGAQNDAEVGQTSVTLIKLVVGGENTPCGDAATETEVDPGEIVTWCFVVRNTGSVDLQVTNVSDPTLGLIVPIPLEDQILAPGTAVTVSASTAITADTVNQASVTGTPLQPDGEPFPQPPDVTDSSTATVNALTADLSVVKSVAETDPVAPGATLNYTLVVTNAGPDDAEDVKIVDTLPVGLTYGALPTEGWSCAITAEGRSFECVKADDLIAGTSSTITYTATVDTGAARGASLTNTSVVSATTTDPDPNNNTDTATVTTTRLVVDRPDIPEQPEYPGPFTPEEPDEVLPLVITGAASTASTSLSILLLMAGTTLVVTSRRTREDEND